MNLFVRRIGTPLLLVTGLWQTALTADELLPRPGLYEVTTRSEFGDLPVPPTTVTTSNCLTAEQLSQDPKKVFADLPAAENCSMETFEMAGGKLEMRLSCQSDDGNMTMEGDGDYDPDSYRMNTVINIESGGAKVRTTATVDARRVGDC